MLRIIDGVAYDGKRGETFTVRAHELGNGHIEVTATRNTVWVELDWTADQIADHVAMLEAAASDPSVDAERLERHCARAAGRAKTRVRKLCKAMGADTLLTLTYRFNETDLARVKRDLKEFNRRVLRVLPSFRFVGAFERQKRGAWHVHMATANIPRFFIQKAANGAPIKVKSYDLLRAIWRGVTKDRGGAVNVKRNARGKTPAGIASYISKYIAKDFEIGQRGSNRYAVYGDFELPPVVVLGTVSDALEAVQMAYDLCGGRNVYAAQYSRFGDWFYLHGELGVRDRVLFD